MKQFAAFEIHQHDNNRFGLVGITPQGKRVTLAAMVDADYIVRNFRLRKMYQAVITIVPRREQGTWVPTPREQKMLAEEARAHEEYTWELRYSGTPI